MKKLILILLLPFWAYAQNPPVLRAEQLTPLNPPTIILQPPLEIKPIEAAPATLPALPEKSPYEAYIPSPAGIWPLKYIRLVIHVIQDGSGRQNFVAGNPYHRKYITDIISFVNWSLSDIQTPNSFIPGYPHKFLKDSRVRVQLDTVFYHSEPKLSDYRKLGTYAGDSSQDNGRVYDLTEQCYLKYVLNNPVLSLRERDSSINVFLFEAYKMSGRGMAEGLNSKRWLNVVGAYYFFQNDSTGVPWNIGGVMTHEIGHNLGLAHVFDQQQCIDLQLSPKGKTNNTMDAWPGGGRGLSPLQMGVMQYGLEGKTGDIAEAMVIPKKEWWISEKDSTGEEMLIIGTRTSYTDINIRPGATLTVSGHLQMAPGRTIRIYPRGQLIIEGGEISGIGEAGWNGIELEKNRRGLFGTRKSRSIFHVYHEGYFHGSDHGIMKVEFSRK